MKKIDFYYGNQNIMTFGLENYRIFLTNDEKIKYRLIQAFENTFYLKEPSDYAENTKSEKQIRIDDNEINLRKTRYYYITSKFDLEKQGKLYKNSLLLDYLNCKLKDIEVNEDFNMLSILYGDIAHTINEYIDLKCEVNIEVEMNQLDSNTILKHISPSFTINNDQINSSDLSYGQTYIIQLKILKEIANRTPEKLYLALLDTHDLPKSILEELENIKIDNLLILVFAHHITTLQHEKVILYKNKAIDLSNDNDIYDYITQNSKTLSNIYETKEMLKSHFSNENNDITALLKLVI